MSRGLSLVAIACLAWAQPAAAASLVAGKALFAVCAGCHGFLAEGQTEVKAPKLTGLERWYLMRQLEYFRDGIRGAQAGDTQGEQMAPFVLALSDERAVEDVVAYIGSLPHSAPAPTLAGDAERGRAAYALCGACHGQNGEGNEQLSAPALTDLNDWYIVRQLELFKAGVRGAHAQDTFGRQMLPIAGALGDEQQLRDLAVYISTLGGR